MPSQNNEADDELVELLRGVDHHQCSHLMRAFDIMAERLGGVNNGTVLWTLASMLAKVMAVASDHEGMQKATGEKFGAMVKMAYPVMVRALEDVRRQQDGRRSFDA